MAIAGLTKDSDNNNDAGPPATRGERDNNMKMTDGKKTVEIIMHMWDGKQYGPDMSADFFDGTEIVEDVDYCISQAEDWENYRGDFYDPEAKEEDKERGYERYVNIEVITETRQYYITADLGRAPVGDEEHNIPAGAGMYAGTVKAIITALRWEDAMEAGKECITGALKKGIVPVRWGWKEVDWAARNGEAEIYAKYQTITWLTSYRVRAGMTLTQLAKKSGVNIRQIQKAERCEIDIGNMTARNVLAIARALNVEPEDLI